MQGLLVDGFYKDYTVSEMRINKMESIVLFLFAILVGVLLPIQAASNAGVSRYFGDVSYAVLISFIVGVVLVSAYILISKPTLNSNVANLDFPNYIFYGGLISVLYTAAITYLAPRLGVGNTLFIIVVGQMTAALIVDHFGIFESVKYPITLKKVFGALLMVLGLYLARKEG